MHKTYYRCFLTPLSPLALSCGAAGRTDSDALVDSCGRPFLPASSIAGVLRSRLGEAAGNLLFGTLADDAGHVVQSRVLVYDGTLAPKTKFRRFRRDGVEVDDHKNTVRGAKYDFEITETAGPYSFILETADDAAPEIADELQKLLLSCARDELSFGGKTTRGYGRMKLRVEKRTFDLTDSEQMCNWLKFDPMAWEAFYEPLAADACAAPILVDAEIELQGSLLVRQYTTECGGADYSPLEQMNGRAVIPGTSWAGMFRHRVAQLATQAGCAFDEALLFGEHDTNKPARRSNLAFSETTISGGCRITRTRTAIERFTGGAAHGKLYTSTFQQGGTGRLQIRQLSPMPHGKPDECAIAEKLLAAVLMDLDNGLLNAGGEGGVGRGILRLKSLRVNGVDVLERLRRRDLSIFEGRL